MDPKTENVPSELGQVWQVKNTNGKSTFEAQYDLFRITRCITNLVIALRPDHVEVSQMTLWKYLNIQIPERVGAGGGREVGSEGESIWIS